jgi:hypothetical protein
VHLQEKQALVVPKVVDWASILEVPSVFEFPSFKAFLELLTALQRHHWCGSEALVWKRPMVWKRGKALHGVKITCPMSNYEIACKHNSRGASRTLGRPFSLWKTRTASLKLTVQKHQSCTSTA